MSKIPDTKRTKYNHNDPFRWVDSQWEKFMLEQRELKANIKQLQDDLVTCNNHFQRQRGELMDLIARVPSVYLTDSDERTDEWRIEQFNRNRAPEDQVHTIQEMSDKVSDIFGEKVNPQDTDGLEVGPWEGMEHTDDNDKTWIYESPDGGKTLYRRELGDYDTPRVQVDENKKPLPEQLNLFQPNDVY